MEYGLWNFHGGFWAGGNPGYSPSEGVSRNFYNTVNNELEPSTFHLNTPVNSDSSNPFTSSTPAGFSNTRTNLEFISGKNIGSINGRTPITVQGDHEDLLHSVGLEGVSLASDLVTEQNGIGNLPTNDSSLPHLLNHLPSSNSNNNSNFNNNHNIITRNDNNNNSNNNNSNNTNDTEGDEDDEDSNDFPEVSENVKTQEKNNEEVWNNVNGHGTNIKVENNNTTDYLFQPGYHHTVYGMVFSKMTAHKKEAGASDVTDEDDEAEKVIPQVRIISDMQNIGRSIENRLRSSGKSDMEVLLPQHVTGGIKISGKKRAGPLTPQRVRYEREEYRCQICAYSCTVEKAFYKHLKIHSVGRQINQVKISCVICGKDRSSEIDMNKHMKKHRDDRYFCCDICIFKTVQLKKLIQHRRMHTGEKPHLCPHCSYRSARRDNLRSHVRRVHKKDNLFCDTFSPRGLVLGENNSNITTVGTTSIPSTNINQHPRHSPSLVTQTEKLSVCTSNCKTPMQKK